MCSRSPYHMAEWPMGALPPIIAMRVVGGELVSPFAPGFKFRGRDGECVVTATSITPFRLTGGGMLGVPILKVRRADGQEVAARVGHVMVYARPPEKTRLGTLVLRDPEMETHWSVNVDIRRVFATQATPDKQVGGVQWFHFLDSMNQDVTPYVHAAVARLAAKILEVPVKPPVLSSDAQCTSCKAFRYLPGPDQKVGDAEGRVPSLSTIRKRDDGPWQAESYWCSARQSVPPDIIRLVQEYNNIARRGHYDPVLPLDRAGEDCRFYLHQSTGSKSRSALKSWQASASYAPEPVETVHSGIRTVRTYGAQWEVSLSTPLES